MRHIADTAEPHRPTRRARARVAGMDDRRAKAFKILRLMLPLVLLFFLALGQAASAHQASGQHQPHAMQTMSHHAEADISCCDDLSQDEAACQARCLASCGSCTPLPLPTALPELTAISPAPATTEPLRGAIASPHLRPPSLS